MRRLSIALAALAAAVAAGGVARAQNYPWCAYYGDDSGENCGFSTHDQCMAAISGMAGSCERNTQYVAAVTAPRSTASRAHGRKRHRRPN